MNDLFTCNSNGHCKSINVKVVIITFCLSYLMTSLSTSAIMFCRSVVVSIFWHVVLLSCRSVVCRSYVGIPDETGVGEMEIPRLKLSTVSARASLYSHDSTRPLF